MQCVRSVGRRLTPESSPAPEVRAGTPRGPYDTGYIAKTSGKYPLLFPLYIPWFTTQQVRNKYATTTASATAPATARGFTK